MITGKRNWIKMKRPKIIYLQHCDPGDLEAALCEGDDCGEVCEGERTWCVDKINDTDDKYILYSEYERVAKALKDALDLGRQLAKCGK